LLLASGCDQPAAYKMPPPAVLVQHVSSQPVNSGFDFIGRTEAVEDVSIRARVEGYLLQTHFTEGEVVDKGQLLFDIDPQPYIAIASQAQAELARAQSQLNVARQHYRRGQQLYPKGTISESAFDELKGDYQTAKAVLAAAEAALEAAQLNLAYTKIEAPITGRIGRKSLSIGDLVTPAEVLATLVQQDPIYVSFQVSEKTVASTMQASREAGRETHEMPRLVPFVTLPNGTRYQHPGKLDFLDNRVDPATGTVTVRTVFPNPDGLLIPGQYVDIRVQNENPRSALLIPQRAVQEDQLGRFVLVLDSDNVAHIKRVELGTRVQTNWVVESGLQAGERIIVDGIQKVRIGKTVAPLDETDADRKSAAGD
jgi:membrane fusion protein (multidrug efflux system)